MAAQRIAPIQVRLRTVILAEREACAQLVESARSPTAAMTNALKASMRRNPDYVMRSVVDTLVGNLARIIRARI